MRYGFTKTATVCLLVRTQNCPADRIFAACANQKGGNYDRLVGFIYGGATDK